MLRIALPILEAQGQRYRKSAQILAREVSERQTIETITSDGLETTNTAEPGDYIVENTTDAAERYVIGPNKFNNLYQETGNSPRPGWKTYSAKSHIVAIEVDQTILKALNQSSPFEFTAAWGQSMIVKTGDFLASPADLSEVYRIARKEFFETYV